MIPSCDAASADDLALVQRARDGHPDAFEELVRRHSERVYRLALRMTRSAHDAEEITQETFLSAHQALPHFRGDAAVTSWLHRIAANFALMRLRHRRVASSVEDQISHEVEVAGTNPPPSLLLGAPAAHADKRVLDDELRCAIAGAVEGLPDDYRVVFLLKDVEELSYDEIAAATGESMAAIKSRLHRARLTLRKAIQDFYADRPR